MKRTSGKRADLDTPATKGDLEDMAAHIVSAISRTLDENYPTKDDLKNSLAAVEKRLGNRIDNVEQKVEKIGADVSDIRRRVIDLEVDTVKRREFEDFKQKITPKLL